MCDNPKTTVEHAYDSMADWYLDWAKEQKSPRERYAKKVLDQAPAKLRLLELGCGAGVPITRMLLDAGARVVGNDISTRQIDMAKSRCPEAEFFAGDMTTLSFEPASFDGAVCFYAIFHLPRAEQRGMLANIYLWLKPSSVFVVNFATLDQEEIDGEFLGHGMFWSSFPSEQSKAMMRDVGFEILKEEILEAGDGKIGEDDPDYGVKFLWIAAKKGGSGGSS